MPKPNYWILIHKHDGRVLCVDNKRRIKAADVGQIKLYKRLGDARRRAGFDFICRAVYSGETVDCTGRIT